MHPDDGGQRSRGTGGPEHIETGIRVWLIIGLVQDRSDVAWNVLQQRIRYGAGFGAEPVADQKHRGPWADLERRIDEPGHNNTDDHQPFQDFQHRRHSP